MENKGALLTYHYREVPSGPARDALVRRAAKLFVEAKLYPHYTQMAIEARPPVPWDKGRASLYILRTTYGADWPERVRIVYAGDDDTDEDVMETLNGLSCTFRVSKSAAVKTAANYRLKDPEAVLAMLRLVEERMAARSLLRGGVHQQLRTPLTFSANFLITCVHSQSDYPDSDEESNNASSNGTSKRRRRNSKGSPLVQQLQIKAAGLRPSTNYKGAALRCHDSQDAVVVGH